MEATRSSRTLAPAGWLADLANQVASLITPMDVLPPIGCHYYYVADRSQWEVTLFASRTQLVGGPNDGQTHESSFTVDIARLVDLFDEPPNIHWQALSMGDFDDLGSHVSAEGLFAGHSVWVRVLSSPPEAIEPGREAHVYDARFVDKW